MSTDLELLTNSRMRTFRRCPRLHFYVYLLFLRAVLGAEELRFGDLVHRGLRRWWEALLPNEARWPIASAIEERARREGRALSEQEQRLVHAIDHSEPLDAALAAVSDTSDPFELVRAQEMLRAYHLRWIGEDLEPLAVEVEFRAPLINPATGAASKTFDLGGKLDVIVRRRRDVHVFIVEHKTAKEDIRPGTEYWRRLRLDTQVSQYFVGAHQLGFDPVGCIYDVLAKPQQRPLKATPAAEREATIPKYRACPECKKKGGPPPPHVAIFDHGEVECGKGYNVGLGGGEAITVPGEPGKHLSDPPRYKAGVRLVDETPDEYRVRLREAIGEDPARFFARGEIVRLENDQREHAFNTWMYAAMMREAARANQHPMNPEGCRAYGRLCDFFSLCIGDATADDQTRFQRVDNPHVELEQLTA